MLPLSMLTGAQGLKRIDHTNHWDSYCHCVRVCVCVSCAPCLHAPTCKGLQIPSSTPAIHWGISALHRSPSWGHPWFGMPEDSEHVLDQYQWQIHYHWNKFKLTCLIQNALPCWSRFCCSQQLHWREGLSQRLAWRPRAWPGLLPGGLLGGQVKGKDQVESWNRFTLEIKRKKTHGWLFHVLEQESQLQWTWLLLFRCPVRQTSMHVMKRNRKGNWDSRQW